MDISAHSPDVRESRPSFRKPANEASRRNYRRHSPSSSQSRSPSPGGWKRVRSPLLAGQEDGGSKKGRHADQDGEKGREDDRFRRGTADAGSRGYGYHSRDRHSRAEDYDHNYNRRHSSDRGYHNSAHVRTDHSRHDDRRYARRSPERSTREWANEESGYRRKESRVSERDRARDDRSTNARPADRDRNREDESDVREHYKIRDREARYGQERFSGKERNDGSDGEADRYRHVRRNDSRRDAVDVDGRDRDIDKMDGRERHKFKSDTERLKEQESRRREKDEVKELENHKVEEDCLKIRDKSYRGHDEYQRKTNLSPDLRKNYSSSEPESTGEHSRQRCHGQDSKKGGRDKKQSGETLKSKFSSADSSRGAVATSDYSNELKRLDDKYSKGSKWGPEAETTDATAASSDPEAAKMAAMKAAALVNINLGGIKSVDEKKKLLWGSKDQQKPAAVASGTNRWETVRFADRDRQDKFHKLMGVKGEAGGEGIQDGQAMSQGTLDSSFTTEKQEELQQDLEKQFTAGLRRRDGRTVGLGL